MRRNDTPEDLSRRLRVARTWLREQFAMVPIKLEPPNEIAEPYPVPSQTYGWAAGDAAYAMGACDLQQDQARHRGHVAAVRVLEPVPGNPFLHTYDFSRERVTINGAEVAYEPDGSWRIVVSQTDPGHPNWVSTAGRSKGLIWLRWFLPDETPARPHCRVVEIGEAK